MHQNVRTIITSYGNTAGGSHVLEERKALVDDGHGQFNIVTEQHEIPCPTNVADMIAGFGAIDQHNALRQGISSFSTFICNRGSFDVVQMKKIEQRITS